MFSVGYYRKYDGEKPTIHHCPPEDVVIELANGEREAVVGWTEPWAEDNSGRIPTKTNNIGPMSKFYVGRRETVKYVFTDDEGNSATCEFDIILTGKIFE